MTNTERERAIMETISLDSKKRIKSEKVNKMNLEKIRKPKNEELRNSCIGGEQNKNKEVR